MFKLYWRQKQQQTWVCYTKNTQLHEDKQLGEKHPDVCDEDAEERSELFIQSPANDDVKNKTQRIWTFLKQLYFCWDYFKNIFQVKNLLK